MNIQAIADLSAELLIKYYENDYLPFLSYMDKDARWYGPADGQFIRGRKKMIEVWNADEHTLRFTMGNLRVEHTTSNHSFCVVILTYIVTTHYPDNNDISLHQRTVLTWCERVFHKENGEKVKKPFILVCDITTPHEKHHDDTIYPKNFQEIYDKNREAIHAGQRIHFHCLDKSDYFVMSDTIIYIEAAHGGKHCILHTAGDKMEVMSTITKLEKQYGHLFLRCHQSYLVNPEHISSIRRFSLTLDNGTELPIPEKKYTAFRDSAKERMNHK